MQNFFMYLLFNPVIGVAKKDIEERKKKFVSTAQ